MENIKFVVEKSERIQKLIDALYEKMPEIESARGKLVTESYKDSEYTGIVLTKLDSTSKGGIVFSIINELNIPVKYIGVGEKIDDMKLFDPVEFVDSII